MISIVCPFYNEETILSASVQLMLNNLSTLEDEWELIIVNDGSTDQSFELAKTLAKKYEQLNVVGYQNNRGRGYAIRVGAAAAKGDILVTTEIDSSWGDDIVHRLTAIFKTHPDADMIIASPNLPTGGYKNVPWRRVFISRLGNFIIRMGQSRRITMYTGMTRAYTLKQFLALPLDEDGKEFHLEVVRKMMAFNCRIYEIPAILEWRDHKLSDPTKKKRTSSSKAKKLIRTHLLFSIVAAPFRYLFPISILLVVVGSGFLGVAVRNLFFPEPSIFYLLTSFFLFMFAFLIFILGILTYHGLSLSHEIWRLRREIRKNNP